MEVTTYGHKQQTKHLCDAGIEYYNVGKLNFPIPKSLFLVYSWCVNLVSISQMINLKRQTQTSVDRQDGNQRAPVI